MKKLIYILLLLPALCFGQTQLNINQVGGNFLTGSVWKKMGPVISGSPTQVNAAGEPTVIYEGSAQLLTNTTGSVFKMWFSGGDGNIWYAESLDGLTWTQSATFVVSAHFRSCVLKVSTTYYMYAANATQQQIDQYTSSNGTTWTLAHAAVISVGGAGTWNHQIVANSSVINDGGTWRMILDGEASAGAVFTAGYFQSTDGITWTQPFTNPVINAGGKLWGAAYLTKVGSTFYVWLNGSPSSGALLPTDTYRWSSPDCQTWTINNSGNPVLSRTMADEGVGTSVGQASDVCLVEANGKTFMFYSATPDGSAGAPTTVIKLAIANYTIANLVATNEGDGGDINIKTIANPMSKVGQFIAGSTSGLPTAVTPNNTTSPYVLFQTGNGGSSNLPVWTDLFGRANTWTGLPTFSVGSLGHLDISGANAYNVLTNGTGSFNRAIITTATFFNGLAVANDGVEYTNVGSMIFSISNSTGDFKWSTQHGGTPAAGTDYLAAILKQNGNFSVGTQTTPTALFQVTQGVNGYGKITTTASSGAVVGTLTQFTNTFRVGQTITAFSETHTISAITDDTHITTDNWTNTNSTPGGFTLTGGSVLSAFGNGNVTVNNGNVTLASIGNGLSIKEGTNAAMGTGTLSGGTLVVSNTRVTVNSRIFITDQGGTITNLGTLYISARTAGISFTVSSSNVLDASNFAWVIIEPAP